MRKLTRIVQLRNESAALEDGEVAAIFMIMIVFSAVVGFLVFRLWCGSGGGRPGREASWISSANYEVIGGASSGSFVRSRSGNGGGGGRSYEMAPMTSDELGGGSGASLYYGGAPLTYGGRAMPDGRDSSMVLPQGY
ncbi:unnamed protein product [Phaeothamnion confervicola]